ncbi:MAG: phosphate starvation-inducible protein PhoH, partial [Oscillatoriales cyanobacterium]
MTETLIIELPSPQSAMSLAGHQEQNLKTISKQTGANLVMRGQELLISGTKNQVELCHKLVRSLSDFWKAGKTITGVEIQTARLALDTNRQDDLQDLQRDVLAKTRRGEEIRAKTFKQRQYVQAVRT